MATVNMTVLDLFRILDHCGCCMRARFFNNVPSQLEYYFACESCSEYKELESIRFIFFSCEYELQRYSIKELVGPKGWTDYNGVMKIMARRNALDYVNNGKHIMAKLNDDNVKQSALLSE